MCSFRVHRGKTFLNWPVKLTILWKNTFCFEANEAKCLLSEYFENGSVIFDPYCAKNVLKSDSTSSFYSERTHITLSGMMNSCLVKGFFLLCLSSFAISHLFTIKLITVTWLTFNINEDNTNISLRSIQIYWLLMD